MSIRKRNDSVKPGRGIDGAKGENFTKVNRGDPLTVRPDCADDERSYSRLDRDNGGDKWAEFGESQTNGMRNKRDFSYRSDTRDIFDDVQANDGPRGGAPSLTESEKDATSGDQQASDIISDSDFSRGGCDASASSRRY